MNEKQLRIIKAAGGFIVEYYSEAGHLFQEVFTNREDMLARLNTLIVERWGE